MSVLILPPLRDDGQKVPCEVGDSSVFSPQYVVYRRMLDETILYMSPVTRGATHDIDKAKKYTSKGSAQQACRAFGGSCHVLELRPQQVQLAQAQAAGRGQTPLEKLFAGEGRGYPLQTDEIDEVSFIDPDTGGVVTVGNSPQHKERYSAVTIEGGLCCVIIEVRAYDHDDAKREICCSLYRPREPHRLNLFTRWKMGGEMVLMPGGVIWDNQGREWWQLDGKWELPSGVA